MLLPPRPAFECRSSRNIATAKLCIKLSLGLSVRTTLQRACSTPVSMNNVALSFILCGEHDPCPWVRLQRNRQLDKLSGQTSWSRVTSHIEGTESHVHSSEQSWDNTLIIAIAWIIITTFRESSSWTSTNQLRRCDNGETVNKHMLTMSCCPFSKQQKWCPLMTEAF